MPKVVNIFLRSCGIFLEILALAIILVAFLIRSSSFQTYVAQRAAMHFSKEWKTQVQIKKVDINFFERVYLEGVSLNDRQQRPLLKVASLEAIVREFGTEHLTLDEIVLCNGQVWICAEKPDGSMNFAFISDYFSSTDSASSTSPFTLHLNKITLKNTGFRYDDFRIAKSNYGFDPNHIQIQGLNLGMSKLALSGSKISFHLDRFRLYDRSGLKVKNLTASFAMDSTYLKLSKVRLVLNRSNLRIQEMGYSFQRIADKNDFLNKAYLTCVLAPSSVDLKDVSLFVPALKGMDEKLELSARVYNFPNRLKIRNLMLKMGKRTRIKAHLELPDFNDWTLYSIREHLVEANINMAELNALKLPGGQTLNLDKKLLSLGNVGVKNLSVKGFGGSLFVDPVSITTEIGGLSLDAPLKISPKQDGIALQNLDLKQDVLRVDSLNLAAITGVPELGVLSGKLSLNTLNAFTDGIQISGGKGQLNSIHYNGYSYRNIDIKHIELMDQTADLALEINDPNLVMSLKGSAKIDGKPVLKLQLNLDKVSLLPLGFTENATDLEGAVNVQMSGTSMDAFLGRVTASGLKYSENGKAIRVPELSIDLEHQLSTDQVTLRSTLVDLDFIGKVDVSTFANDILYSCSRPLPSWFKAETPKLNGVNNRADATLVIHDAGQITELFQPQLSLATGTKVVVKFNAGKEELGLDVTSNRIQYDDIVLKRVRLVQGVMNDSVIANLSVAELALSDSLTLFDVNFFSNGSQGVLRSSLGWDGGRLNESKVNWKTSLLSNRNYDLLFDESRFSLNGYRWNLKKGSDFQINGSTYWANDFTLLSQKNNQEISVKGTLSERQEDQMKVFLTNVSLADLSGMLGLGIDMSGKLGGEVGIADPFEDLTLTSKLTLDNFRFNNQEIGTVNLGASYDETLAAVIIKGDLLYQDKTSLLFNGSYKVKEKDNNLALAVTFENTDLGFVNGFMDPSVVANVAGKIKGSVDVTGTLEEPLLNGSLLLDNAAADFALLGCRYTINGRVQVEKGGFYVNKLLSIKDSEGNNASLDIAVFHNNFQRFTYNADIDFEKGYSSGKNTQKLDRFLVLNTQYKEGDSYYGKAYALGYAHIEGVESTMSVDVNLTTRKGSKVIFPMYGSSELEDESIIHFISKTKAPLAVAPKLNYSGIDIKIGFNITPDADIRLVFNEQTQDEIRAKTNGKLNFSLDAFNQMKLNGTLGILPGSIYNFAMGPARKPFYILDGTIVWKGDVEHADMNVLTSYTVKHANMLELMPSQNNEALSRQNTQCLLRLNGDLMAPSISFQLDAPQAPEAGKALLNRINSDVDELNRQFFSLMLFNKFQPLQGGVSANESAALDLVESQINAALAQMSKSYQVKMDIGSSNISTSVQKSFLDDRLVVSGSFGVDNSAVNSASGGLVGDVSLEYLINEQGTFRVNAFNRSNGNTVKENAGPFTQGAGFSYHEDFNAGKDFILMQTFLDIFRKKEKRVVQFTRKKQKTKVPSLTNEPIEKQEQHENE